MAPESIPIRHTKANKGKGGKPHGNGSEPKRNLWNQFKKLLNCLSNIKLIKNYRERREIIEV
jgi:hypothetical protein